MNMHKLQSRRLLQLTTIELSFVRSRLELVYLNVTLFLLLSCTCSFFSRGEIEERPQYPLDPGLTLPSFSNNWINRQFAPVELSLIKERLKKDRYD